MTKCKLVLTTAVSLLALGAAGPLSGAALAQSTEPVSVTTDSKVEGEAKLDASSLVKFKESVEKMKASLNASEKQELTLAFDKLAASAMEPAAGGTATPLPEAIESNAKHRPAIETVYIKLGTKLDGKTFDDIVEMVE